jgi:hypothetical protein
MAIAAITNNALVILVEVETFWNIVTSQEPVGDIKK